MLGDDLLVAISSQRFPLVHPSVRVFCMDFGCADGSRSSWEVVIHDELGQNETD